MKIRLVDDLKNLVVLKNAISDVFPGIEFVELLGFADVNIINIADGYGIIDNPSLEHAVSKVAYSVDEVIDILKTIAPRYLQEYIEDECEACNLDW